jgi:DNA-binding IclR family transcriptional regulator
MAVQLIKTRAGIQSVEVGFALLDVLARAVGPLMLRDLASRAGMSAAKAHRYLVSFQRLGLVVQDASTTYYDLGPAALKLGLASLSRLDAVKLARERVGPLMLQIGHTLALAVWGNRGPTIVHWEESPQAVTVSLRLGDVMPLLSSATGRCFAAHVSREAIAPLLADELAQARQQGRADLPRTAPELDKILKEVRNQGLARVVDTLLQGVCGFCAPVFDSDGHMVLGIVALGSAPAFDAAWDGAVATRLRAAAALLSDDLGNSAGSGAGRLVDHDTATGNASVIAPGGIAA